MINFRKTIVAGLLGAAALTGLPAMAQQPGHGDRPAMHGERHGMHHRGGDFLRRLDLTEAQRDQVFRIRHEQAPVAHEAMKVMRRAHEELRTLAKAPSFDRAKARSLVDAAAKAHADLAFLRIEGMSKIRSILTPEQRAKLDERSSRGFRQRESRPSAAPAPR